MLAFWISPTYGQLKQASRQTPPLTLQWEVSYPTGLHQMSLVFRKNRVDLFTNTSLWQDTLSPRLGHFISPLNETKSIV